MTPMPVQIVAKYKWKLNDRLRHCGECAHYAGQIKSREEWDVIGTPPLHPGCGCQLVFAGATEVAAPDGPPAVLSSPATPAGVNNEAPPGSPRPDPDDYQPANPPQTPPAAAGPRPRRR